MFFGLIAIIFLIANGVEASEPAATLTSGAIFQSKAECEGFMDTDMGARSKQSLERMVRSHFEGEGFVAKFQCIEVKKEGEEI